MRWDGTLEVWDENLVEHYMARAQQVDPRTGYMARQRRDRGARIQDLAMMIDEALKAYQGYFVHHPYEPFRGWFQFARSLNEGDTIRNKTTGDVYTIKRLIQEGNGTFLGQVLLSGGTDPTETDRLELDPKASIVFGHAAPRSEVASLKPDSATERVDQVAPFYEHIEWSVRRTEPGTVGKRPFDRERQALPKLRQYNLDDPLDPGIAVDIYGWWIDHIVQFDLFGRNFNDLYGKPVLAGGGPLGLVSWFQDFMQRYRWVFIWNGIQQLLEWQSAGDEVVSRYKNDMAHRGLLWYARTERISTARTRRIDSIDVVVNIGAPEELTEASGCPAPTGQIEMTVNDQGLYGSLGG
jgi:hypothetical protein